MSSFLPFHSGYFFFPTNEIDRHIWDWWQREKLLWTTVLSAPENSYIIPPMVWRNCTCSRSFRTTHAINSLCLSVQYTHIPMCVWGAWFTLMELWRYKPTNIYMQYHSQVSTYLTTYWYLQGLILKLAYWGFIAGVIYRRTDACGRVGTPTSLFCLFWHGEYM